MCRTVAPVVIDKAGGNQAMSRHVPDTTAANAALATAREPSRRDHLPCQVRRLDEIDGETIRRPGETGERPIYAGRFNLDKRKVLAKERVDL
jgi:hypothetical protein